MYQNLHCLCLVLQSELKLLLRAVWLTHFFLTALHVTSDTCRHARQFPKAVPATSSSPLRFLKALHAHVSGSHLERTIQCRVRQDDDDEESKNKFKLKVAPLTRDLSPEEAAVVEGRKALKQACLRTHMSVTPRRVFSLHWFRCLWYLCWFHGFDLDAIHAKLPSSLLCNLFVQCLIVAHEIYRHDVSRGRSLIRRLRIRLVMLAQFFCHGLLFNIVNAIFFEGAVVP
jgi:hypothetical protein